MVQIVNGAEEPNLTTRRLELELCLISFGVIDKTSDRKNLKSTTGPPKSEERYGLKPYES